MTETRPRSRMKPGTGAVLLLLALGITWTAWTRLSRPVLVDDPRPRSNAAADALPELRLDLNLATAAELTVLPGVGPRLAERIVADRQANGPFYSIADLERVPGIGPATLERVRPCVTVE